MNFQSMAYIYFVEIERIKYFKVLEVKSCPTGQYFFNNLLVQLHLKAVVISQFGHRVIIQNVIFAFPNLPHIHAQITSRPRPNRENSENYSISVEGPSFILGKSSLTHSMSFFLFTLSKKKYIASTHEYSENYHANLMQ